MSHCKICDTIYTYLDSDLCIDFRVWHFHLETQIFLGKTEKERKSFQVLQDIQDTFNVQITHLFIDFIWVSFEVFVDI